MCFNYSAYSPDLPGCMATGTTREEVEKNMYEAIEMHLRGLMKGIPRGRATGLPHKSPLPLKGERVGLVLSKVEGVRVIVALPEWIGALLQAESRPHDREKRKRRYPPCARK